ncbi:MAG: aminoacyl-tRNA hydrolase [Longimicrobiales bacterium]|nr:aminoacyl-tRNA hydrolase [Longimicrobiales bacterium]
MRYIVGLGNPGAEYDATRHNVGWWLLDRVAYDWNFGPFERERNALVSAGTRHGEGVQLIKPTTFMNRSGAAVAPLRARSDFDPADDLMVLVDDAALDAGGVRIRPSGSAGGHNGLKSIEGALGTREYARLRIGVGRCPPGDDLVEWVLGEMPPEDEDVVVGLLPDLVESLDVWMTEGVQAAMSRYNR